MSSSRDRARRLLAGRSWQLTIGAFAAGLALAGANTGVRDLLLLGAALLGVGVVLRLPLLGLLVGAALLGGCGVGTERVAAIDLPGLSLRPGSEVRGRAVLVTAPRASRFGWSGELELAERGAKVIARAPAALELPRAGVGDEVQVAGRIELPPAGDDFDWAAHLRRRGILREFEMYSLSPTGRSRGGFAGAVDGLRRRAERTIDAALPEDEAALVRGMVLGQDERIDPLVRDDFRDSGLAHLLAVSGQNVMLLAALCLPLLGLAGAGPAVRTAVLLGLIVVYVPLAGAGPSLQRAGVMGAAGLVAIASARPASRSYALVLAAAVTLAANPRAAGDPGWQLSFAAVAGIIWVVPALRPLLRPLPRPIAEGAGITIAATLATAPLLAYHFDTVPLAGLPANLLALPAVPLVMWAGMLLCALGQIPLAGAGPAADAIGAAATPVIAYLVRLARTFAELPGGLLSVPVETPGALAVAYAALAAAVLLLARVRHAGALRIRPGELAGSLRRMRPRRRVALAAAATALTACVLALALRPPAAPDRLTVRFLDVGQGDATLVQHPDGTAVLFDGGPPEARVVRLLRGAGVRRLAVVVATHASRDHHGGLREVLERMPVDVLLDGGDGTRDRDFRELLAVAGDRGVRVVPATAPLAIRASRLDVRILSPDPRPPGPAPDDPNPRAVVAIVGSGSFDLLLSADAESDTLSGLPLGDVDAMKVPHHGSADPGLPAVLERLRPEVAAIEVGENSYGHPAPSTLAALRDAGVRTWRTDRHGTVSLTVAEHGLRVTTER